MTTHRIAVIGSGPVGMVTALLLAEQGHDVTVVDRDPGPVPGREWDRVGVMQFRLPHGLRPQARDVLHERLPDLHRALLDAGAVLHTPVGAPDSIAGLNVRRPVMERVMWDHTTRSVARVTGHVDEVVVRAGHVSGIVVDGSFLPTDVVVDASGRAGHLSAAHRPAPEGHDCGAAYAARLFRLRPGAEPGPLNGGPGFISEHEGFLQIVFQHDAGTFSVLVVRSSSDRDLAELRHADAFMAAAGILPGAREWTAPDRAEPIDAVRAGANLLNRYQGQPAGVTGLVVVGDALCTTNPSGARGLSLGFHTAAALADITASLPVERWATELDAWAGVHVRPWFENHLHDDDTTEARWRGEEPECEGPISSALVAAASAEHPEWKSTLAPYYGMMLPPTVLDPFREPVREMLRAGWRPAPHPGPTRDDLVAAMRGAMAPA